MTRTIQVLVLGITLVTGFNLGLLAQERKSDKEINQVIANHFEAETQRLEWAYEQVDSCASDNCLESWAQLIGDKAQAK